MTWVAFGLGLVLGVLLPRVVAAIERLLEDEHDYGTVKSIPRRRETWWD